MAYELIATSDYLRNHEAFLIHVDLSGYLLEYYHQRQSLLATTSKEHDSQLKDAIACFAIHLAARTTLETHAWTLQMVSDAPYSLFVTGSTGEIGPDGTAEGFLVGHVLTENIRHSDTNALHAQYTARGISHKSFVRCDEPAVASMVEEFYRQSEQLPIRIALSDVSDTATGLVALPGYDVEWFASVHLPALQESAASMDKTRMRTCRFKYSCDCSPEKLIPFFRALGEEGIASLYEDDSELLISCPRCGRKFAVSRSDVIGES